MMKKITCIVLVLLFFAHGSPAGADERRTRVAALSGIVGLAMLKTMQDSVHRDAPYDFEVFRTPDLAAAKLITGETDIAGLPTNMASILYNRGVEIQIAAIIGWGVLYVVGTDPLVEKWTDLKGKEIFVPGKAAVSDILFRYFLSRSGLDPERDVKIMYLASPVEASHLAAAGRISLAVLPEPWVTELLGKNPAFKVALDFQETWQRLEEREFFYPQTCIAVRKSFAQERPEALKRFLEDLEESILWLRNNPHAGGRLAEERIQISYSSVVKGLGRTNLQYTGAREAKEEIHLFLQRLFEYAPQAIGGKMPDEGFYAEQ